MMSDIVTVVVIRKERRSEKEDTNNVKFRAGLLHLEKFKLLAGVGARHIARSGSNFN